MSEPQPAATPPATPTEKNQRTLVGRVVSDRMQKTVTVLIERRVKDTLMGKTLTGSRKDLAQVPSGEYKNGDLVEIAECRPISKTKSWTVTRLIQKSKEV
jgi:small subunit ribosomal protein S17